MSSFYPSRSEEEEVLTWLVRNEARTGASHGEELLPYLDEYLDSRLEERTLSCKLTTLSDFLAPRDIAVIDRLKVDVKKSEWDVLQGLVATDWPKVRQLAMEVRDIDGRVSAVAALLEGKGYRVAVEQDDLYSGSTIYNLYARRVSGC